MSITGDLPDWSILVEPNIQIASVTNLAVTGLAHIHQQVTPFRVWGVWMQVTGITSAAYPAAIAFWGATMQDGAANAIIRAQIALINPSTSEVESIAIPVPGYTPILASGNYSVDVNVDALPGGMFGSVGAGIFYSNP